MNTSKILDEHITDDFNISHSVKRELQARLHLILDFLDNHNCQETEGTTCVCRTAYQELAQFKLKYQVWLED